PGRVRPRQRSGVQSVAGGLLAGAEPADAERAAAAEVRDLAHRLADHAAGRARRLGWSAVDPLAHRGRAELRQPDREHPRGRPLRPASRRVRAARRRPGRRPRDGVRAPPGLTRRRQPTVFVCGARGTSPGGMVSRSDTQVLPRRYANARRIGIGGMGEILLADDTTLDRPVVLKLLSEDYARDESLRRRFLREANAAARLSGHPHVVTVYDVGEQDGRPFISMEYLENGDLRSLLAHGLLDRAEALRLVEQAASALDAAHRSGVVHRDV